MFVIFTVILLVGTCCNAFKITQTPLYLQQQINNTLFEEGNTTRNYGESYQNYGGNYGDLIHLSRQPYDVLLTREVVINRRFTDDAILKMDGDFGRSVSAVWALNFGNERGFVEEITTQGSHVYIKVFIKAGYEIRLLVDVYGFN